MATLEFNSEEVQQEDGYKDYNSDFEPIPKGEYVAIIESSEVKDTKKGDGQMLVLTWQIIDGEYKNRLIFDNLCLVHPNEKTVQIAKSKLVLVCNCAGKPSVQDSDELHNIPMIIKLGVYEDKVTGSKFNNIKNIAPIDPGKVEASRKEAPKAAGGKVWESDKK